MNTDHVNTNAPHILFIQMIINVQIVDVLGIEYFNTNFSFVFTVSASLLRISKVGPVPIAKTLAWSPSYLNSI